MMDYQYNNYDGAPTDGSARGKAISTDHMEHGGSWRLDDKHLRSAQRSEAASDYLWKDVGFRLVAVSRS
jgi:formylglycine-generating enzyme required for sulfatase activity